MAIYLTSPDKHVIGRCEIKIEEPSIQRVYWTNKEGEEIDKLIPESEAILRIETRAWNPKIKLEIELTHKSGEPITTKLKDIKEVSVNKEGVATQQYKWSIEDTIVATVKSVDDKNSKGTVQKKAEDLVKKWGIWIDSSDNSEMHYFYPNKPYTGVVNRFIKSVYEAYYYYKEVSHAKVFDDIINLNQHDVFVIFKEGAGENSADKNKNFNYLSKKHQKITTIRWNDRKGSLTENQNGEIVAQSPAAILLHEMTHAYLLKEWGLLKNNELDSTEPNDPKFKVRFNGYRLEEIITKEWDNPAAKARGEGQRDIYKSQLHKVNSTTELPNIKWYSKY